MHGLRAKLPPVNSLVVFEAAARLLSFTQAAAELNVTQAAVSRQIRVLEDHLGQPLFRRGHRSIRLTPAGARLQAAVAMGLEHIANTAIAIRSEPTADQITVSTSIAFATFWLMPRIARFRAAHPELELRLVAADPFVDLVADDIDIAIRYGDGNWPGLAATRLFDEEIFPVCSPDYREARPDLDTPADLLRASLLHLEEIDRSWITWPVWLQAMGVEPPRFLHGHRFNNYAILLQAARDGQGIALGWRRLIADLLADGSLVRPIDSTLRSRESYFLVMPEAAKPDRRTDAVRDWILAESQAEDGTLA